MKDVEKTDFQPIFRDRKEGQKPFVNLLTRSENLQRFDDLFAHTYSVIAVRKTKLIFLFTLHFSLFSFRSSPLVLPSHV